MLPMITILIAGLSFPDGLLFFTINFFVSLFFFLLIHSAINTQYKTGGGILSLKFGYLFSDKILLQHIKEVQIIQFSWSLLLKGFNVHWFCNRFSNGVLIQTENNEIFLLTPSNPEKFIIELSSVANQ
jgi:hypothetical protein